jgi:hypothetical protein
MASPMKALGATCSSRHQRRRGYAGRGYAERRARHTNNSSTSTCGTHENVARNFHSKNREKHIRARRVRLECLYMVEDQRRAGYIREPDTDILSHLSPEAVLHGLRTNPELMVQLDRSSGQQSRTACSDLVQQANRRQSDSGRWQASSLVEAGRCTRR